MTDKDLLHRFLFSDEHIRGELVQLNQSVDKLLSNADYPKEITALLSEMSSAAALLSATLKFEGEISLQIQGKGIVNYAVITATHKLTFRGVARWDESLTELPQDFKSLCSDAVLVITLTPEEGERYQGVVALDQDSFAECIEKYFEQSEQLLTRVYLFSDSEQNSDYASAGLLLQVLPKDSGATEKHEAETFQHFATLADTLTQDEILSLPVKDILHRLYHEHDIELYDGQKVEYACTCSKQRSAAALLHVEKAELLSIVEQEGIISMNCQYCHKVYNFDAIDVEAIHSGNVPSSAQNAQAH